MLSIRPLSAELQKIAIEELNENPATIYDNVQYIREWVQTQDHLRVKTDDQSIVTLLRGCKYNLELVKNKMEMMCTMRTNLPQFFSNRDPFIPDIQELLSQGVCLPLLKTKSPGSPRVVLGRRSNVDAFKIKIDNGIKYGLMLADIVLNEDDNLIVGGVNGVADCSGGGIQHMRLFDLGLAKSIYKLYNNAYAIVPRGGYAFNVPKFAEVLFDTFKHLVLPEHKDLVHIYSSSNPPQLYEAAPLSILPEEYGGAGGTLEELTAYWKKKVESYRDWFLDEEQYRLDKTKLPDNKTTKGGWFRKSTAQEAM